MKPDQIFQKFYQDIANEKFETFYFLYGEENFLSERASKHLLGSLVDESSKDFNFHMFYVNELKEDTLNDCYYQYPMMASRRVIVIKEVQTITEVHLATIQGFFKEPSETTVMIFLASEVDKKKKFFKTLSEKSLTLEFKKPYDNQIPYWVRYLAEEKKCKITDAAIHILHEKVGSNLMDLHKELQKITEFISPKNSINEDDVLSCVSSSKEESLFLLVEDWINKDQLNYLKKIEAVFDQGENEIGLIHLIARHLRILIQIKQNWQGNKSKDQLSKQMNIPVYFLDKYIKQSYLWEMESLKKSLAQLFELENLLKKDPDNKKSHFLMFSFN